MTGAVPVPLWENSAGPPPSLAIFDGCRVQWRAWERQLAIFVCDRGPGGGCHTTDRCERCGADGKLWSASGLVHSPPEERPASSLVRLYATRCAECTTTWLYDMGLSRRTFTEIDHHGRPVPQPAPPARRRPAPRPARKVEPVTDPDIERQEQRAATELARRLKAFATELCVRDLEAFAAAFVADLRAEGWRPPLGPPPARHPHVPEVRKEITARGYDLARKGLGLTDPDPQEEPAP